MRSTRVGVSLALTGLLILDIGRVQASSPDPLHPRAVLVEDAYQLRDTIEETHPDPYLNGGGKIAFHRRFQEVVGGIPEQGMTAADFLALLRPFVAAIGDSHTALRLTTGEINPIGLPVGFRIVEGQLVISRVADSDLSPLFGARLLSIEGVTTAELMERQRRLRGLENRSTVLAVLILRTLTTRQSLAQLIPEWRGGETLRLELSLTDGSRTDIGVSVLDSAPNRWLTPPSRISMPSLTRSDVAFTFLETDRSTALLVIRDLMRYREACELWLADGLDQAEELARAAHRQFHGTSGPQDTGELLSEIPSATPTIAELVDAMQAAGTRNLIVDLRGNTGGNSAMREILVYLLFGDRAMRSIDNGYQIVKYSSLVFEQYDAITIDRVNRGRPHPLRATDYDFSEETEYRDRMTNAASAADRHPTNVTLEKAPSFWSTYQTGKYHQPRSWPEHVVVLTSATTFSSGFNVATGLVANGARIVGTASAQAGNGFGDMLMFSLEHTGIEVGVSYKQNVTFPDDPERGRCLEPGDPLTYETLAKFNFDPNAEVLLALETLRGGA
jgi:hypothetical protein